MTPEQKFSASIAAWQAIENSTPEGIADVARALWGEISVVLSPVIGQRGVSALVKRSLHLVRIERPAFNVVIEVAIRPDGFMDLHAGLINETSADAFAINSEMLNTFHRLLEKLIGDALTRQLLNSIVDTPPGDHIEENGSG